MKQKIEIIMAMVVIAAAIFAAPKSAQMVMSTEAEESPIVIVIDAGHGGDDPGKVGVSGTEEKDINLEIALKLRDYMEEQGFEIVMTREEDTGLEDEGAESVKVSDLKNRVEIIENTAPVLAVSIHQNSYTDSSVSGAQVFYYGNSAQGEALAGALQQSLVENVDPSNTRAAKANESYYILKKTSVPTVIVECGFLSNPTEEALLCDEDYQNQIVEAIYEGIVNYLNAQGG
ncbi:MAG: N-acetylmuramoyl-L-alanine amidase CwlD [Clostridiales bacterium]|nr:N-acetylmuramoyl-L-alanine amidase CwlD [Clostridiales bacterium]